MASILKSVDKTVGQALTDVTPGVIRGVIHLLLALYAVRFAPDLPKSIQVLFTNQYFRLFIFSLILWTAKFSPTTAIMISVAFMLSVNAATNKPLWEFLENVAEQPVVQQSAPVQEQSQQPPMEAVVAVQNLAEAAVTPEAAAPAVVIADAEKAINAIQTTEGATAVTQLAEQAMLPEAAPSKEVIKVAEKAVLDMAGVPAAPAPAATSAPAPAQEVAVAPVVQAEGCYPVRQYDMSMVNAFDPSEMEVSAI